jgi:hypothetical protein
MLSRGSKSEAESPEIHSQTESENDKNEKKFLVVIGEYTECF